MARTLFLQLPPELGGVKYGPFPGSVTIGSDPKRSQLCVDPSHGVYPVHVTLAHMPDGTITVAPARLDCKVFLVPAGQPHVWPATGPVQARPGDVVIVGTPAGPRFQMSTDAPIRAPTARGVATNVQQGEHGFVQGMTDVIDGLVKPAGSGIAGEIHRQTVARALARPGPVRSAYVVYTKLRSGQLFTPYVMVGLVFALVGLIGTGSVSCTGVMYVIADVLGLRR
ncbi:MAG: hypothetical protein ABMA64_19630 [Myxococcota bacterium]